MWDNHGGKKTSTIESKAENIESKVENIDSWGTAYNTMEALNGDKEPMRA